MSEAAAIGDGTAKEYKELQGGHRFGLCH